MERGDKSDLFEFMLERVSQTQKKNMMDTEPQAFGRWFAELYFMNPRNIFISDGSRDGKIDLFFATDNGNTVQNHVLNTKFTKSYNKTAPPAFYQEIKYFWHAFENVKARGTYLEKAVKAELRPRYKKLFEHYDSGNVELMFVTNHRCNDAHYEQVKDIPVKIFHMDDLIQHIVDDIDGAMPRTPPIALNSIHALLSADKSDTEVSTSIVFARLIDFIRYMDNDPFDLLFNRNVRVAISVAKSTVNKGIRETFKNNPKEFAFSNNGITMLCEKQNYDPGQKTLTLENPRVVNGSQTLHSVRDVSPPSLNARVMVRIIEIEPPVGDSLNRKIKQRKEVISKIAVRSNQQNPIKSWDLASNDDFQLDLFRFFRTKGLFYERRDREWKLRSRELRSVGVQYGTKIKWLTQLIASFHWQKPRLGPAVAKSSVTDLFEGETYQKIRQAHPHLAFQLYLIDEMLSKCHKDLAAKRLYVRNFRNYEYFVLFCLVTHSFTKAGVKWESSSFTAQLQEQINNFPDGPYKKWYSLAEACCKQIQTVFKREAKRYSRKAGEALTYANFFKSQTYTSKVLKAHLSSNIKRKARVCIKNLDKV
jgi:hypothetical protein